MGYAVYQVGNRYGGYGVPAICEHPDCNEEIDRGVSYACGGEPFSDVGCDRYFCSKHLHWYSYNPKTGEECRHKKDCHCKTLDVCARCENGEAPFPYKPETQEWLQHLLTDESWEEWRKSNPETVEDYKKQLTK